MFAKLLETTICFLDFWILVINSTNFIGDIVLTKGLDALFNNLESQWSRIMIVQNDIW